MLSLVLVKQFNDIIWLFSFYRFGLTSLTNVQNMKAFDINLSKANLFLKLYNLQMPIFRCFLALIYTYYDIL